MDQEGLSIMNRFTVDPAYILTEGRFPCVLCLHETRQVYRVRYLTSENGATAGGVHTLLPACSSEHAQEWYQDEVDKALVDDVWAAWITTVKGGDNQRDTRHGPAKRRLGRAG
jgi:hypothetical protein